MLNLILLPFRINALFTSVILLCLFYFPSVSAAEYSWTTAYSSALFPTPAAACSAYVSTTITFADATPIPNNATSFHCNFTNNSDGSRFIAFNASRQGDTCPEGHIYNSQTGACDQDCSSTEGQQLAAQGPLSPVLTDGDGVRNILPELFSDACFDGCSYEVQSSFSDRLGCYLQSGSTTEGFCNYRVTGTGQSCPASTGVPAGGGDPLNPSPPPDDPDDPTPDPGCLPPYVWNGDFCQSDPGDGDGGGDGDGDGDGPGDGGGSGPGDGGGDGGGGDGPGDGDGDGDGSGDGSGGDGDGSGDGGGGNGDCTGEDCGPGEGEGDGLTAPEPGTFDDAIADYEQKIADSLEDIKNKSGQFGDLIKQKLDVHLSSGNGALPCFNTSIMGENVGFCFSTYSEQLSILRNLLLFLATIIALYIIFREDK